MLKKEIREEILKKRANLDKKNHKLEGDKILNKIMESDSYKNARNIFIFISFGSEINTHDFIRKSLSLGKNISVPVTFLDEKIMKASSLKSFSDLKPGAYNILAPSEDKIEFIDEGSIDLVIVPGAAFDRSGYRIGYGGGYYDKFLAPLKEVKKIGIAFSFQIVNEIPISKYDIPVNLIYTENEIISCT